MSWLLHRDPFYHGVWEETWSGKEALSGDLTFCLLKPLAFRDRAAITMFDTMLGGINWAWPRKTDGSVTERRTYETGRRG